MKIIPVIYNLNPYSWKGNAVSNGQIMEKNVHEVDRLLNIIRKSHEEFHCQYLIMNLEKKSMI